MSKCQNVNMSKRQNVKASKRQMSKCQNEDTLPSYCAPCAEEKNPKSSFVSEFCICSLHNFFLVIIILLT